MTAKKRVRPASRVVSETVGQQVKAFREARNLSQRAFADACSEAGWKITPAAVENIEGARRVPSGETEPRPRREISVDELLALAAVLGVNPIDLLVPGDAAEGELVPIPPDIEVPAADARAWIAGTGFLQEPNDVAELVEVIRRVPKLRGAALNAAWWTPERIREQNRVTLAAEQAEQAARAMAPEGDEAPGGQ